MPLKTPPAVEPITDAELQAHLGMDAPDFAARLDVLHSNLTAARQLCESDGEGAGIAFITQTWTYYADAFPLDNTQINLRGPLQSVASVKFIDASGTLQTLNPLLYQVDTIKSRILPGFEQSWPQTRAVANAVQVEYICGFGNAAAVPEMIKQAIKLVVGQNERYQTVIEGGLRPLDMPNAAKQLLRPFIDYRNR